VKAQRHGIPVHMDGARIFNAAVALDLSPQDVCKDVDSISVCFSKVAIFYCFQISLIVEALHKMDA
jgi:threonine aldolase